MENDLKSTANGAITAVPKPNPLNFSAPLNALLEFWSVDATPEEDRRVDLLFEAISSLLLSKPVDGATTVEAMRAVLELAMGWNDLFVEGLGNSSNS